MQAPSAFDVMIYSDTWSRWYYFVLQEGGPRRFGILTLWYASTPRLGCMPNLGVRQARIRRALYFESLMTLSFTLQSKKNADTVNRVLLQVNDVLRM